MSEWSEFFVLTFVLTMGMFVGLEKSVASFVMQHAR